MSCPHHNHKHCLSSAIENAEALCQSRGLRFTAIRKQVFEIICSSHKALTAAEIMEKLGNNQPPVTYRALEFLSENSLIHRVASLNGYVGCNHLADDQHIGQLLICENCRDVTEIDAPQAARQLSRAAKDSGFAIVQTHIEVLGKCTHCQQKTVS